MSGLASSAVRKPLAALAVCVAIVALTTAVTKLVAAATTAPSFTLSVTPSSQSVPQGQSATYTVTLQSRSNFTGPVALSNGALPTGATATFSPTELNNVGDSSSFVVTPGFTTPVGTKSIKVIGTGGGVTKSVTVSLTITESSVPKFTLTATPGSVTMSPGDTATFTVGINRRSDFTGNVTLGVSGLPTNSTATFNPRIASGSSSTLSVVTKSGSPVGDFTLTIKGTNGTAAPTTSVALTLSQVSKPFTISAPVQTGLAPGLSHSVDLTFKNPNSETLFVTSVSVTVKAIGKGPTAPAGSCSKTNYTTTQYSGPSLLDNPLSIPAGGTASLSSLGVPVANWPTLSMVNSLTQNQDVCRGAKVTLGFTGAGHG